MEGRDGERGIDYKAFFFIIINFIGMLWNLDL